MNISAASEQFKILKESLCYSPDGSVSPGTVVNLELQNHSQMAAWNPILPQGFCQSNFQISTMEGKGVCQLYACAHTFTSITSIRPGQLTPEINVTPQDRPAGNWCYDWLPVCREGNWGMHIWDQALRKPLTLWALSGASRVPKAHSCPLVPCHTPESWHFPVQGSLVASPASATGPRFHHRLRSGH